MAELVMAPQPGGKASASLSSALPAVERQSVSPASTSAAPSACCHSSAAGSITVGITSRLHTPAA